MRLKTVFTLTLPQARMVRQLAEYEAQQNHGPTDTGGFLVRLIARAHLEMEAEQREARKIKTCKTCGQVWSGLSSSCPKCGQWSA